MCGIGYDASWPTLPGSVEKLAGSRFLEGTFAMAAVFLLMMFVWLGSFAVKRFRRRNYIRLQGNEVRSETLHACDNISSEYVGSPGIRQLRH